MSEHTLGDIFNRFLGGFCEMKDRIIQSYGYAEFIIIYGIAITLLIYQNKETWLSMITQRGHPYVLLFVLGYFVGYVLLYTWYSPIAGGNRFVLSLFLPAMLLIVWSLSYAQKQHLRIILLGREVSAPSISVVVVLYLIPYLAVVFPTRISSMFGGS